MQFGTGLGGSVVGGLYGSGSPATLNGSGAPAPTSGPTGSPSIVAKAWGVQADGGTAAGQLSGVVAALALAGLVAIWWALPK